MFHYHGYRKRKQSQNPNALDTKISCEIFLATTKKTMFLGRMGRLIPCGHVVSHCGGGSVDKYEYLTNSRTPTKIDTLNRMSVFANELALIPRFAN